MRQARQGAVSDHGQVLELKTSLRLTGQRDQDLELEVRHARLSLQLGVEGCRQQGEGPDQLKPSAPLTMVQRAERPGWRGARISSWNKLTLQVLTQSSNLKLQLQELNAGVDL